MIQRIKHPLVPGLCIISVFILTILNVCRKLTGDLCKTKKKKAPVDTRFVMHSTSLLWIKLCRESTSDDDSDDSDDADMYGCEYEKERNERIKENRKVMEVLMNSCDLVPVSLSIIIISITTPVPPLSVCMQNCVYNTVHVCTSLTYNIFISYQIAPGHAVSIHFVFLCSCSVMVELRAVLLQIQERWLQY